MPGLKFRPYLTNTNEIWQVAGVEVSDATGNSAHNSGMTSWGGNAVGLYSFNAWPLAERGGLEIEAGNQTDQQDSGPRKCSCSSTCALGELNRSFNDHRLDDQCWRHHCMTLPRAICRRAPQTNDAYGLHPQLSDVHFTISPPPAGTITGTCCEWCAIPGRPTSPDPRVRSSDERDYCQYRDIPLAAQTADFTFAIQQSRTVEFTVKPQLPEVKAAAGK